MQPQYIFETSWEVCNRVGGIYAVLSTRAASMQAEHKDKVVFFGPDFGDHSNLTFKESKTLLKGWRMPFKRSESLKRRAGWNRLVMDCVVSREAHASLHGIGLLLFRPLKTQEAVFIRRHCGGRCRRVCVEHADEGECSCHLCCFGTQQVEACRQGDGQHPSLCEGEGIGWWRGGDKIGSRSSVCG